jgi:anti-sigma B factor antagonist
MHRMNGPRHLRLETRIEPDMVVFTPLEACLDADVAPALRAALVARIDQGHRSVMVNLERVEFIDSSGLGALISGLKRLGRDGELKVCCVTARVRSLFELTQLNRIIEIVD